MSDYLVNLARRSAGIVPVPRPRPVHLASALSTANAAPRTPGPVLAAVGQGSPPAGPEVPSETIDSLTAFVTGDDRTLPVPLKSPDKDRGQWSQHRDMPVAGTGDDGAAYSGDAPASAGSVPAALSATQSPRNDADGHLLPGTPDLPLVPVAPPQQATAALPATRSVLPPPSTADQPAATSVKAVPQPGTAGGTEFPASDAVDHRRVPGRSVAASPPANDGSRNDPAEAPTFHVPLQPPLPETAATPRPVVPPTRPHTLVRPTRTAAGPEAQRHVEVRIGTIEIHAQAPEPAGIPPAAPDLAPAPEPGGFESFAMLRSYAPWER